jgi:imidazoleglycerol phosphate dehydratase HisB
MRAALMERAVAENPSQISFNIDGKGRPSVRTDIPFFDQMLTPLCEYALASSLSDFGRNERGVSG